MTSRSDHVVHEVLRLTIAVGNDELSVEESVNELMASVVTVCGMKGLTEMWEVTQTSNDILRAIYPEYGQMFEDADVRARGQEEIPPKVSAGVVIRQVLGGVEILDKNPKRRAGASKMLSTCPKTVAESDYPFADTKGIWSHTHRSVDDNIQ